MFTKVTGRELKNWGPEHLIENIFILVRLSEVDTFVIT